jgi:hypothetical protein
MTIEGFREGYCQMLWMAGKGEVVYPLYSSGFHGNLILGKAAHG